MPRKRKRIPNAWRVERQLVRYIYEFPDITRADLAKRLGQSPAAISLVIRRLIEKGWLCEAGKAVSLGGRRPVQLRLARGSATIVGVEVAADRLRAVVMDADGSALQQEVRPIKTNGRPQSLLNAIVDIVKDLHEAATPSKNGFLGFGLAVAGVVYGHTGMAKATPGIFGWETVDVQGELEKEFDGKIVVVDNASRSRLSYEVYVNRAMRETTALLVDVGAHVGGALSVRGIAYEGAEGAPFDLGGCIMRTPRGEIATLEEYLSEPAILGRIRDAMRAGYPTLIRETTTDPDKVTMEIVAQASNAGDQLAYRELTDVADGLGQALVPILNLLRPRSLLVTGHLSDSGALLIDHVKRQLRLRTEPDVYENLRFVSAVSDENAAALGAAHKVLNRWLGELSPESEGALEAV